MNNQQKKRLKKFRSIVKDMGGSFDGHNAENYKKIARYTASSVPTVQAWLGGHRIIPQSKLTLLEAFVVN